MKLAISNISWHHEQTEVVLPFLRSHNVKYLEIAPTKIWSNPLITTNKEIKDIRAVFESHEFTVIGLHSLFYPRTDLGLFRDTHVTKQTLDYLEKLIIICSELGGKTLIFGSPINRKRGSLTFQDAFDKAQIFFSQIAKIAQDNNTCMCIEPLGISETDFISSIREGLALVDAVSQPGFGLHLDIKSLFDSQENFREAIRNSIGVIKHVHINDPDLGIVGSSGKIDHLTVAKCLQTGGYNKFVSIEQRTLPFGDPLENIKTSVDFVQKIYLKTKE